MRSRAGWASRQHQEAMAAKNSPGLRRRQKSRNATAAGFASPCFSSTRDIESAATIRVRSAATIRTFLLAAASVAYTMPASAAPVSTNCKRLPHVGGAGHLGRDGFPKFQAFQGLPGVDTCWHRTGIGQCQAADVGLRQVGGRRDLKFRIGRHDDHQLVAQLVALPLDEHLLLQKIGPLLLADRNTSARRPRLDLPRQGGAGAVTGPHGHVGMQPDELGANLVDRVGGAGGGHHQHLARERLFAIGRGRRAGQQAHEQRNRG